LTVALGAHMVFLGKAAASVDAARTMIETVLDNGKALEKFADVIAAHGGNPAVCEDESVLPRAQYTETVTAGSAGFVEAIDPMAVAQAALSVNAGRVRKEDAIDPATGVKLTVRVGSEVQKGDPIAVLHHNGRGNIDATMYLKNAVSWSEEPVTVGALIKEIIADAG